ncbi:malate:quinone oxidoreductase [Kocuria rhizophila]|nr:malate:quinone oxidoreductase [Kocuria rhizophila]
MFLGAGGGALPLLQKSGIKEAKGFGGFPVSGLFLRNTDPTVTAQRNAKVYGQAPWARLRCPSPAWTPGTSTGRQCHHVGPYRRVQPNFLEGPCWTCPRACARTTSTP